ncbi:MULTISPECIES: hypothetical protein [Halorubrum]|uniref:Uncharacterized protein n=1 Tax=Halorubrum hochstenium ATCC 700873 TaxID=1227481 RepID=M0FND2_9EURY|nr:MULTISPECIES: hypothetical protein [Halorubrum]ELZ61526.1 hypothetical protein C467_00796 [Halorubrum hochstenium ATCC 700873]
MAYDPLSPAEALRTPAGAILAASSLLAFGYSLVFVGRALLGLLVVAVLSVGPYLWYRVFAAVDAVADGVQRLAAAREREVAADRSGTGRSGTDRTGTDRDDARRESTATSTTERVTDRER